MVRGELMAESLRNVGASNSVYEGRNIYFAAFLAAIAQSLMFAFFSGLIEKRPISEFLVVAFMALPFSMLAAYLVVLPTFVVLIRYKILVWWVWLPFAIFFGIKIGLVISSGRFMLPAQCVAVATIVVAVTVFRYCLRYPAGNVD
ncbi:hypothetical protein [Roseateles sp. MS654]|uniref:hypothetical protein n=1 Tax=Roseateles sp. MS654 TaxID=3412685 RepID=UPI003C2FC0E7